MSVPSDRLTVQRPRLMSIVVVTLVATDIALANLSPRPFPPDLLNDWLTKRASIEHAFGWPLVWYWRSECVPSTPNWPVSRFDGYRFFADLATWPAILVAVFIASEWVVRRYRPRFRWRLTTLLVLMIVSALTALANLSYDESRAGAWDVFSYGWPVIWYRHMTYMAPMVGNIVERWDYSGYALGGNLAIWLTTLALPAVGWERLMRHFEWRLCFSVRTMLVGVGLAGVLCAWFVAARNRADEQDAIIERIGIRENVSFQRSGPKWLDVLGADRFRRCIVAARMIDSDDASEELLERLARVPSLQLLDMFPNLYHEPLVFTPRMAATLAGMRQLRTLNLDCQGWGRDESPIAAHRCVVAVAELTQLERLRLSMWRDDSGELANLSNLTNLKTLALDIHTFEYRDDGDWLAGRRNGVPRVLDRLPALPRLTELDLHGSCVGDADLDNLAHFARLKSLDLAYTSVSEAGLAKLAALEWLEELAIDDYMDTAAAFEAMVALKRLSKVHIDSPSPPPSQMIDLGDKVKIAGESPGEGRIFAWVPLDGGEQLLVSPAEVKAVKRACRHLREAHPGLVIDGNYDGFASRVHLEAPWSGDGEMGAYMERRMRER